MANSFKSEIDLSESKVDFQSELCVMPKSPAKTPQLRVILEQLSIANESHKEAIANLSNPVSKLVKLNSKIMCKMNGEGFIKTDLLNTFPTQNLKDTSERESYSLRNRDVVYDEQQLKEEWEEEKVVRHKHLSQSFLKDVLKRGSENDKNKFLKYPCPQCSYRTWTLTGVQNHQTMRHGFKISQIYSCPDCKFTANTPQRLEMHRIQHKKEPDLVCPDCSFKCKYKCALDKHIKLRHMSAEEAGAFQCSLCPFKALSVFVFERHKTFHRREENAALPYKKPALCPEEIKRFSCEKCSFETVVEARLTQHQYWVHGMKKYIKKDIYKCKHCSYVTKYNYVLKSHLAIHKDPDKVPVYHCNKCSFQTDVKTRLSIHLNLQHNRTKFFHCHECKYQTHLRDSLKRHIFGVHRKAEYNHFCEKCSFKARNRHAIIQHNLSHQGPDDSKVLYWCANCSYFTNTKNNLVRHVEVHMRPTSIRWHCCDKCAYKSRTAGDLRRHNKSHNRMYYSCEVCSKKIMNHKQNLRRHMLTHQKKGKWKDRIKLCTCYCCGYESEKSAIKRHLEYCSKHLLYRLSLGLCLLPFQTSKRKRRASKLIGKSAAESKLT